MAASFIPQIEMFTKYYIGFSSALNMDLCSAVFARPKPQIDHSTVLEHRPIQTTAG